MFSLDAHSHALERPLAVLAIAVGLAIVAALSLAFTGLIAAGAAPLSYGAILLGGGLEQLGPLPFVINAVTAALLALGLLRRWNWARRLSIIYLAVGVAVAVPAISSAVVDARVLAIAREGLQIVLRVAAIYCLSQEHLKDWFAAPAES